MKVIAYICCALAFTCLMKMTNAEWAQDKFEQQLLDAVATDDTLKMKRPFCNAFTGCGIKRSFYGSPSVSRDVQTPENMRLPVSLYKALLKAASQSTWNTIVPNDYRSTDVEFYAPRKVSLRDRLES